MDLFIEDGHQPKAVLKLVRHAVFLQHDNDDHRITLNHAGWLMGRNGATVV